MTQANSEEFWFSPLLRIAGYVLLALSLLDIISIFIPPGFTNPAWEFQMASHLVERSPVPLIGLVFLLIGEKNFKVFKFLSRAALVAGILFFLLLPLIVSSAWRIHEGGDRQIVQQSAQLQYIKQQLSQAQTDREITDTLSRMKLQIDAPKAQNPQQLKTQILAGITKAEQKFQAQAAKDTGKSISLTKNVIKTGAGTLIAGAFFIMVWRGTTNTVKDSKKKKTKVSNNLPLVNE
jgi:hypothetical protein